jgi:crotonobetainyl-CoA:carnitine CoA-transferase CaiB-like acyl-CoA transferase
MDAEGARSEHGAQPLAGLRVLAVEQYAAGPFGTLQLASLGADVIKIEDPVSGGDIGRSVPPDGREGDSLFFQTFNHGKRSVALDLRSEAGRRVFERLVETADAVFYNLRGDVPEKLRLRYADLAPINPRIVCVSLSAYGMTGPRTSEPGYDYLIQGLAGWMELTGEPDGPPTKSGLSLIDFASGYVSALGLVSGVRDAQATGRGRDWDLSLYDVGMSLLTYLATWYLTLGRVPERTRWSAHPTLVPFQNVRTSDGWIVVACAKQVFWQRLRDHLSDPRLDDHRFETLDGRLHHRGELLTILEAIFRTRPSHTWIEELTTLGVPCAPIHDIPAAFTEAQLDARELVQSFPHDRFGEVKVVRTAVTPKPEAGSTLPAPALGADTETVLEELLSLGPVQLAALRAAGAFGTPSGPQPHRTTDRD